MSVDKGKGLWLQIMEQENRRPKQLTQKNIESVLRELMFHSEKKRASPRMQIYGGTMLSMSDDMFKLFYCADDVLCICGISVLEELQKRAEKLGIKKEIKK